MFIIKNSDAKRSQNHMQEMVLNVSVFALSQLIEPLKVKLFSSNWFEKNKRQ